MNSDYRELVIRIRGDEASIKATEARIRSSLGSISVPVSVDAKKAVAETRGLSTALKDAKSSAERLGIELARGVRVTGEYILLRQAITGLLDAIGDSTKQAIRFEFEMAKIAQTVNKTNAQVQAYTSNILDLSRSYGVTNIKIAETVRVLTQAGLSFEDAARGAEILAKTTLLASFDDIESSTEGMIATMRTFNLTMGETERAFEAIGVVSKAYAVESADLVEGIKRAGGVFAATGGNVEELLALMTAVRQTTRESAETIATGFRTIFSRLQRPKTIQFFKELGIQLSDTEGKFIGNYEAIELINKSLAAQGIKPGSLKFAQIAEEIGGIRQISRVIPLLTKFSVVEEARRKAVNAGAESDRDAAKAKETLAFKLMELKQNFSNLLVEVSQASEFKMLANLFITAANAGIELSRVLVKLGPLLSVLSLSAGARFISGVGKTVGVAGKSGPGGLFGFSGGGFVPTPEGNVKVRGMGSDTVPAVLTPGEFVVNRASAQAFGYSNLKKINRFAKGGAVGEAEGMRDRIYGKITDFGLEVPADIKSLGDSLVDAAKEIQETGGTFRDLNDEVTELSDAVRTFLTKMKATAVEVAYNQSIQGDPNKFKSQKGLKEFSSDKFGQTPQVNERFIQALAEMKSVDTVQRYDLASERKDESYSRPRSEGGSANTPGHMYGVQTLADYRQSQFPEGVNFPQSPKMSGKYGLNQPKDFSQYMEQVVNLVTDTMFNTIDSEINFTKLAGKGKVRKAPPTPQEIVSQTPKKIPINVVGQATNLVNQASQPEVPVGGFKTARGSTYDLYGDGTTQRTKSSHVDVGHDPNDVGLKERSVKTVYVDKDKVSGLSAAGVEGMEKPRVVLKDGLASLVFLNKEGGYGRSPSGKNIPYSETPKVGLSPLELWQPNKQFPGYEAFRGMHAGSPITELRTPGQKPPIGNFNNLNDKITSIDDAKNMASALADQIKILSDATVDALPEGTLSKNVAGAEVLGKGNKKGIRASKNATYGVVGHELGHVVDRRLTQDGSKASVDPKTFQNFMAKAFAKNVRLDEVSGLSEESQKYKLKPEELFADLFARAPIEIKKVLASTTNVKDGIKSLKDIGFDPKNAKSYSALGTDITRVKGSTVQEGVAGVPPLKRLTYNPLVGLKPPTSISPPTPTVTQKEINDVVDQIMAEEGGGGKKPPKTRAGSGDGFKGDCCEKIIKAINRIYDLLKSGNVKTSGAAQPGKEESPPQPAEIEQAVAQGTTKGYRVGGLAKFAIGAAAGLQGASLLFKQQSGTEGELGINNGIIGRLFESAVGPLTAAAVVLGSVSEAASFLGSFNLNRQKPQEAYGPFPSSFQEDKKRSRQKFSAADITSFIPIDKSPQDYTVNLNRGVKKKSIPGVGSFSTTRGAPGVIKSGQALNFAGNIPRRSTFLQKQSASLSGLSKSILSPLGGGGTLRAAGLAGGGGLLAGQLLGRGVDAIRDTAGRRDVAIKEGNVKEAGSLARASQVEGDLTNLSSAILGTSFAIASVTGPAAPFVIAAGLGAAVLVKSADQMAESQNEYVAAFGKGIISFTDGLRQVFADVGLADTSAIITARAKEAAAIEKFTKVMDDNTPRLKKAIENTTTRDLTKKQSLEDVTGGQAINDIFNGFNSRRTAANDAIEARNDQSNRLSNQLQNDESLTSSYVLGGSLLPKSAKAFVANYEDGFFSLFGGGKAKSSNKLREENTEARKAIEEDQSKVLNDTGIRKILESVAGRILKSGGKLDRDTLTAEAVKLNPAFEALLKGKPADAVIDDVNTNARTTQLFGNYNESLKEATKATLEFRNGLLDFTISGVQGKFENASLGSVSKVQNLRDRTQAFRDLLIPATPIGPVGPVAQNPFGLGAVGSSPNPQAITPSLRDRVISGSKDQARLAVASKFDEGGNNDQSIQENASQLALDTNTLKEQIEIRKNLTEALKAEVEVEKRRVVAISDSLTALAIGSREERKQAEKTIKVAQLLQQGADINSLSRKQKALVPAAAKFLDEDQQETIRQRILGIGAQNAASLGISGNLAGNIAQIGATGSTDAEKNKIKEIEDVYREMRLDQKALLDGQKIIAEVMNAEFNRVSQQLQDTLNNNGFNNAVNMLGQIQNIKIEMPANFTVDLTNVNTLMEGVTNAITAEVGRQIQSLKNGIQ